MLGAVAIAAANEAQRQYTAELLRVQAESDDPAEVERRMAAFTAVLGQQFLSEILTVPPSQFDGLADRNRVFPQDLTRQQLGHIEVESIKFGGIVLTAVGGTRYANGRLAIAGLNDNSSEVKLEPGPSCNGKGVIAQLMIFSRRTAAGWLRHCFSWVNDGSPDTLIGEGQWKGFEAGGDTFTEDQDASGTRMTMPWYRIIGSVTAEADGTVSPRNGRLLNHGESDGGRYIDSYFSNGSDELYLPMPDGRRVTVRSLIPAFVTYCEQNGIPLEIR